MIENRDNPKASATPRLGNSLSETPETLRLLAKLPPPAELEDAVHRRLRAASLDAPQRGFWSLWRPAQRLQFAGAAALMVALAASAWSVYRPGLRNNAGAESPGAGTASHSGFGTAGAVGHPATIAPIRVAPKSVTPAIAPTVGNPGGGQTPSARVKKSKPSPKTLARKPAAAAADATGVVP
jgi:hypothetical protein